MNNQNTQTPVILVREVERVFGVTFRYDMAACGPIDKKAPLYFTEWDDSLSLDWPLDGWIFLNPDYMKLTAWIKKVYQQEQRGCKIITLWPLSGDVNQTITWKHSQVNIIHGRIWSLVRGCMICKWDKTDTIKRQYGYRWDKKTLTRVW